MKSKKKNFRNKNKSRKTKKNNRKSQKRKSQKRKSQKREVSKNKLNYNKMKGGNELKALIQENPNGQTQYGINPATGISSQPNPDISKIANEILNPKGNSRNAALLTAPRIIIPKSGIKRIEKSFKLGY